MKEMMKLMERKKKEGKTLDDNEKDAKMSVIKAMRDMATDSMGDHLQGLKKVTVASNTPEGVKAGLDMAKEKMEEESPEHEASESAEEEASEHEGEPEDHLKQVLNSHDLSDEDTDAAINERDNGYNEDGEMGEDELNTKIAELMALKAKMKK